MARRGQFICGFNLNFTVLLTLGLLLLLAASFAVPAPSRGQSAPSQTWQVEQGKIKAQGNLSGSGAGGSLRLEHGDRDWRVQGTLTGGMLNDDLSLGLDLAGGWSPQGDWGLWLKLAAEATPEYVDHFQALINLGYRVNPDLRLLASLDYLNKRMENGSWTAAGEHNQYGAGLSLAYGILPGLDLAAFGLHYHTQGQEYGVVGDYEYVDSANIRHYGLIYGGVRGGDYDQAGLDMTYRLPNYGLELGLSLSQIWRSYEEMLGHASRDESTTAGSLRLDWKDILASGVDFNAGLSQEFSSQDRLSWRLGLARRVGPVELGLTYSELSNDLAETDRRIYCSVSLPLAADAFSALGKDKTKAKRRTPFQGAWLATPVSGMGDPSLKVAEPVEKRVDKTLVDQDEMTPGVSVDKNIMTISGLPSLASLSQEYTTPVSSQAAFSIAAGGTSVLVNLDKLPAPATIRGAFQQRDGRITLLFLRTKLGSTVVEQVSKAEDVDQVVLKMMISLIGDGFRMRGKDYETAISGPSTVEAGSTQIFNLVDKKGTTSRLRWKISGQGTLLSNVDNSAISVRGLAPGTYKLTVISASFKGDSSGLVYVAMRTITVVPKGSGDTGDPGDTGGTCGDFRKQGVWTMSDGSGFTLKTGIDASGKVVWMDNGVGQASGSDITSDTGGCNKGRYSGNVSGAIKGDNYSYDLDLSISGDNIGAGSKVTAYFNYKPVNTYEVTGSHSK